MNVYAWRKLIEDPELICDADIILVGRHVTRKAYNTEIRKLKGFNDPLPVVGDKLICTKTRINQNIMKGSIWFVETFDGWLDNDKTRKIVETKDDDGYTVIEIEDCDDEETSIEDTDRDGIQKRFFRLWITPEKSEGDYTQAKSIILDREMFEDRNAKIAEKKGIFDFGYAITVNAAQGSQWDHVVIKNKSGCWREDAHRWLYTAITRAAKRLTIIVASPMWI